MVGFLALDHFHEGHFCHRVEKVQSNQAGGLLECSRDVGQRDGGGVGGQQGVSLCTRFDFGEQRALGVHVLKYGFNDHISAGNALAFHIRDQPGLGACDPIRGFQFFLEKGPGTFQGGLDVLEFAVLKGDFQALDHTPGCDVAAHGAGADYMHPPGPEIARLAVGLQSFRELEDPPQISRSRRRDKASHTLSFFCHHAVGIVAVGFPGVNQLKRRRVVIRVGLAAGLPTHLAGQHFANRSHTLDSHQ